LEQYIKNETCDVDWIGLSRV